MKKALLLSAIASTMIMAGGDLAPAPVVEEESNWGRDLRSIKNFLCRQNVFRFSKQ